MKTVILVKYGEIALRGKNRHLFENKLNNALYQRLCNMPARYRVAKERGRILIEKEDGDVILDDVMPRIKHVLGAVGFCPCVQTENQDISHLQRIALDYMQRYYAEAPFTFKVTTKRANKSYPFQSQEVSAMVGGFIFESMPNAKVDVHNPDVTLHVELRNDAYIYTEAIPGIGGLPARTSGKGMLLLSGGIDSPVAGFLMAKRGVEIEAVYFHAPPFTSERAEEKVHDLAKRLTAFTEKIKLHVVNFTPIQTYLYEHVPQEKLTIFLKRAMIRVADMLGHANDCHCLITGDCIGQVASQTMHGILAVGSAATLPVLRPLAGLDKLDIIRLAEKIETYDISIRPFEDCCTLFVARHPEIRPKASVIEKMEEKRLTALSEMAEKAVEDVAVYTYNVSMI